MYCDSNSPSTVTLSIGWGVKHCLIISVKSLLYLLLLLSSLINKTSGLNIYEYKSSTVENGGVNVVNWYNITPIDQISLANVYSNASYNSGALKPFLPKLDEKL